MNFIEKLFLGRALKMLRNWIRKNTGTTVLGICMILGAVGNAGTALLDDDPMTVFDWKVTSAAVAIGYGFIKTRQQDQHETDEAENRRLIQ